MRIGAILVPLNWRLSLTELTVLVRDSTPRLIVHDQDWAHAAIELGRTVEAPTLSWGLPGDPAGYEARIAKSVRVQDEGIRRLSDPTHILYTSGTTGLPKGALATAQTLSWQTLNITEVDSINGLGDRLLSPLPLFHAGGLNTLANPILMSGGCVSVLARFDAEQCLRLLGDEKRGFTHFGGVPTMLQLMSEHPQFNRARFPTLRHMQVAGGVASQRLLDTWAKKGVTLQTHYGGTEMGPAIAAMPKSVARAKPGSCGFPVRHTRLRIVTPKGADAAHGEVGEIWISGPSITPGYFNEPTNAHASFQGEWFCTGDAGLLDEDGFLYLVDRYKDMYKSGGENVFPAEVERVLLDHPDIAEVAVIGIPHAKWGESGLALIVPRGSTPITLDGIRAFCENRLARYKLPTAVEVVESLPRNATGKVVKADVGTRYLSGELSRRVTAASDAQLRIFNRENE
jgi:fatty-acyl-CoA synthase